MQVPKQIIQFRQDVCEVSARLSEMVAEHNAIVHKRNEISKISKEYLHIKPIGDPEVTRRLIIQGINVEIESMKPRIEALIDKIYALGCEKPDRVDYSTKQQ